MYIDMTYIVSYQWHYIFNPVSQKRLRTSTAKEETRLKSRFIMFFTEV